MAWLFDSVKKKGYKSQEEEQEEWEEDAKSLQERTKDYEPLKDLRGKQVIEKEQEEWEKAAKDIQARGDAYEKRQSELAKEYQSNFNDEGKLTSKNEELLAFKKRYNRFPTEKEYVGSRVLSKNNRLLKY